ncbi:putative dehydrogenase [Diaminobutyricimonas aerilata]|uniref:Putative dehydrogenase n=1 Tax=Diaminobutyricimonas aerilata TaxID=1162967 RepID=A0A2M9CFG5_9MICO|nr:Gfo/Idh/MocA family oxidoreductase [Diaminobutyricimonas aerilata]PJJ70671.1 putative dehydrogenase [Diaminobutyricimonas aerilata]
MSSEPVLRAAIIGTGAVAASHSAAIAAYTGAALVAVTDHDPDRAHDFAALHGEPAVYDDLASLLAAESPDVVHICTPPGVHADQADAALAAGAHVVVEKPPALTLAEIDRMLAAAERADRRLAVVFQQRTGSAAQHVRDLLASGALGRPLVALCHTLWFRGEDYFAVPWRGRWETEGGGTTLSHGIHQLDLLAYLLGDWAAVSGQLWRLDRDVATEDLSTAVVRFDAGAIASVVTSVLSPRETSVIRIDTELATIELEHLYGHAHANWRITPRRDVDDATVASWRLPDDERASGHDDLVRQVYDALLAGAGLPAVAADPLRSFELVAALYASARLGREVRRSELSDPGLRGALEAPVTEVRPPR